MKDTKALNIISELLAKRGFDVASVERSDCKTPDLTVKDGSQNYLIEVKRRYDSKQPARLRTDPIGRRNSMSRRIKDAAVQLESKMETKTVNILWMLGEPPNDDTFYDQLRASLYGIRVVVGRRGEDGYAKVCFYADHSDFCRHKHVLDGVIVGYAEAAFVNDQSPRADLFKSSNLCQIAAPYIEDPREYECGDDILVLRSSLDRSDEAAVLRQIATMFRFEEAKFEKMTKFSTFL